MLGVLPKVMVLLVVSFFNLKFEAAHMGPGQRLRTPSLMTRGELEYVGCCCFCCGHAVTVTLAVTGTDAMMPVSAHCGVNRHWQLEDVHEHDTSG